MEDDLQNFEIDLIRNKKKKKKDKTILVGKVDTSFVEYNKMLDKIFTIISSNEVEHKQARIPYVVIQQVSSVKTAWCNIAKICHILNRDITHVISFILTEMGTEGSLDGTQRLVMRSRFTSSHIEILLKKYIKEYVSCPSCHCADTMLVRDIMSRLYVITCNVCKSTKTTKPIQSGFHATSKVDRKNERVL